MIINPAFADLSQSDILLDTLIRYLGGHAIFTLDLDGYVASWNEGAERLTGYRAKDIIGKHYSQFYTDEERNGEKPQRVLEVAESVGEYHHGGWRRRQDGSRFWADCQIAAVHGATGRFVGFSAVMRDDTERRRRDKELRESTLSFQTLAQSITGHALYLLDDHGRVTSWNTGASRLTGYSSVDVLGADFAMFYTAEDQARNVPALTLSMAKKEGGFQGYGWRVRKDGTVFWANFGLYPIDNGEGRITGFIKVTHEVTGHSGQIDSSETGYIASRA